MSRRALRKRERFASLQRQLLNSKRLFEDRDFPASNRVLFTRRRSVQLIWKRPHEISKSPQFIARGFSSSDVAQGRIRNCWFVAALADLTTNIDLLHHVCPPDQSFEPDSYCGMFRFNFWQFGEWVEVIVDDYLPTYNGRLYFTKSDDPDEFWSALLEKAYAKLCGSYEAMCLGRISEALQDMTGGMIENVDLQNPPHGLFNVMMKACERQSLMGCSIESKQPSSSSDQYEGTLENGLITRHAYSITGLRKATLSSLRGRPEVDLIRLRNPHANSSEWRGAWSDRSPEWNMLSSQEKRELNLTFDDDGEFWMSFDDFLNNFTRLEICMLTPDSMEQNDRRKWNVQNEKGRWQKGVTAGGCRNFIASFYTNPQFRVCLKNPDDDDDELCTVIVSLMRVDRSHRVKIPDRAPIGFAIYKAPSDMRKGDRLDRAFFEYNKAVAMTTSFSKLREISSRYRLHAGEYVVIPSTFNPGQEGDFLLRIFSERPQYASEIDQETKMTSGPKVVITQDDAKSIDHEFWDVFHQMAGEDGEVDQYELQEILSKSFTRELNNNLFALEACRSMISMFDTDRSGALGYNEFRALMILLEKWKNHFHKYDRDHSGDMNAYELRDALNGLGYQLSNSAMSSLVLRYHNKRGTISFDTFIQIVVRVVVMFGMGRRAAWECTAF
ncbi:calpain-A isoform X2 [Nematostella vectensis]|uniref:calpain-A isoform X2 n=1 Tax=Nematostella vectensis TaxID=45351 RepID=UPI0020774E1B|nr:calpain-A isoform X2 [Nematostella vectensis]